MEAKRSNMFRMPLVCILCFCLAFVVSPASSSSATTTTQEKEATTTSCDATKEEEEEVKSSYGWIPTEQQHRCNIPKYSLKDFQYKFRYNDGLLPSLYHEPIIIQTHHRNGHFCQQTSRTGIVQSFSSNLNITLSSSNSFSEHRRTIPLTQYLEELQERPETLPDALSNETWYFFGETHSSEWKKFLYDNYILPPCQTCQDSESVALSFGIGNIGSGVQWHIHGPGFAESLWGRKHWILYPPTQKPTFHPDHTSRHWMEYTYTKLAPTELPWECTLDPGDLIYFPDEWWHATINLDSYTSFISSFTTEHDSLVEQLA